MKKICTLSDLVYQEKLIETLKVISNTVTSTLGPNGKTCILYDGDIIPHVTKDGVTVAEFIQFRDYFQEAINKIIKETARKTGEKVGDGTTTSILLACGLIIEILDTDGNLLNIIESVEESIQEVLKNLKNITLKLDIFDDETIDVLRSIVYMSSNGDKEITKYIVDTLNTIGADGLIDVVLSNNELTHVQTQEGMLIEAPAHVNKTISIDDPYVVLVSSSIEKAHEIKSCIQLANRIYQKPSQKSVIVVAKEFSKEVQTAVELNNRNRRTSMFLVESDGFAMNMFEVLDDMAALLDCKILSTDNSSDFGLQNIDGEHLSNNVTTAIISPYQTVLQSDKFSTSKNEETKSNLVFEIAELRKTGENKLGEISGLEKRLSKFSKSATIYVGGFTDADKMERKDRVDDAVKALASAVNGGILPGGGFSLYSCSKDVKSDIVRRVCFKPAGILSQNNDVDIYKLFSEGKVMDYTTGEAGDAFELGILDPANVAIKSLQQAMVIVKLLLNTHSIIIPDDGEIQR